MSTVRIRKEDNRLTVLTASDPDFRVMSDFLSSLEGFSERTGLDIIWRVVDGLKAFSDPFDCAFLNPKFVRIEWIEPDFILSHSEAIMYGFSFSRDQYVLMMSPDMISNVNDIPAFIAQINAGSEAVAGWRVRRDGVSFARIILTRFFNFIVSILFRIKINDINTCMALVSPKVVSYLLEPPRDCPSPAIYTAISMRDNISEVPIFVSEYPNKSSTYDFGMRFKVGLGRLKEIISFFWWQIRRSDA